MNRRDFLRLGTMGGLTLAGTWPAIAASNSQKRKSKNAQRLAKLKTASIHNKTGLFQEIYENVAFHESGIMYSMMRMDADGIRPFVAADFEGKISLNPSVGKLKLDGPWDYLHGENYAGGKTNVICFGRGG